MFYTSIYYIYNSRVGSLALCFIQRKRQSEKYREKQCAVRRVWCLVCGWLFGVGCNRHICWLFTILYRICRFYPINYSFHSHVSQPNNLLSLLLSAASVAVQSLSFSCLTRAYYTHHLSFAIASCCTQIQIRYNCIISPPSPSSSLLCTKFHNNSK